MVNESVEIVRRLQAEYQPPRMPKYTPKRYSVGVDLGQAADFTAIAVLEKKSHPRRPCSHLSATTLATG
jgi:phage FluMu gp28-like protein